MLVRAVGLYRTSATARRLVVVGGVFLVVLGIVATLVASLDHAGSILQGSLPFALIGAAMVSVIFAMRAEPDQLLNPPGGAARARAVRLAIVRGRSIALTPDESRDVSRIAEGLWVSMTFQLVTSVLTIPAILITIGSPRPGDGDSQWLVVLALASVALWVFLFRRIRRIRRYAIEHRAGESVVTV